MADAHAKPNHEYHLVDPSPWPVLGSIAAFITAVGAIMWMKKMSFLGLKMGGFLFGAGFIAIGIFCSAVTRNQIIAAVLTFVAMTLFLATTDTNGRP